MGSLARNATLWHKKWKESGIQVDCWRLSCTSAISHSRVSSVIIVNQGIMVWIARQFVNLQALAVDVDNAQMLELVSVWFDLLAINVISVQKVSAVTTVKTYVKLPF